MSHEYYNIVIGGEGVRRRSNGINAEKITFFSNFVRVSKGLLSTIVHNVLVSGTIDAMKNIKNPADIETLYKNNAFLSSIRLKNLAYLRYITACRLNIHYR